MKSSGKHVTPLEEHADLAKAVGISSLYFKREDLHPYGSHKGRSIPVMIDFYRKANERHFALSSSGNAALAAALYVKEMNSLLGMAEASDFLELNIFVGKNASLHKVEKLKRLEDGYMRVVLKERPLQALTAAVQEGRRSLRQSTDDTALIGYRSLAEELAELKDIGAVFIGTSSGTTAQALAEYFIKNKVPAQVHIVQTSSCHPIADGFETYDGPDEKSLADAIVDVTAQRKVVLVPLIQKTGARAWVATNDDIRAAQEMTKKYVGLDISVNSALSVAGAMKAAAMGWEIKGATVCMICGD